MLERRFLLSVTAAEFEIFKPGTQLSYEFIGPGFQGTDTYTETVVGPATFNGQSATELDAVVTVTSAASPPVTSVVTEKTYGALTSNGLVSYGADTTDGSTSVLTTISPYQVSFPASISAGQTITSSYTVTSVSTKSDGTTKTTTTQDTNSYFLPSENLQSITVPAGTFNCYELDQTLTVTRGSSTTTTTETEYLDPGIGAVKTVSGSGSTEVDQVLTQGQAGNKLVFIDQPTNAKAGAPLKPTVEVQLDDNAGNPISTDNSTVVTLNPLGATANNPISGNTAALVNGIASFSKLSFATKGIYQLQATDAADDRVDISDKFTIGASPFVLQITSKIANPTVGAATGDKVLYALLVTSKKALQSDIITDTLPAGFKPADISDNGRFSGTTITWNTTDKLLSFDLVVPSAKMLNGLKTIDTNATARATFTDKTTDQAVASDSVKIASSFQVKGVVDDASFQFPKKLTVSTKTPLSSIIVDVIDNTGAVVATTRTKADGSFSVDAGKPGTYTLEFVAMTDRYATSSNGISSLRAYVRQSVTLPMFNTKPIDLGDLYLPKTFLDTSAKILFDLNNYTTNGFQNLGTTAIDLFQFDTTGAEGILNALAGTSANPGPLLNAAALTSSAATDPWVGAMRMMAGLETINLRFQDMFLLADTTGKALAVVASAAFTKALGQTLAAANKNSPSQPAWTISSTSAVQTKLNQATRVAGFVALGNSLPLILDGLGVSQSNKSLIQAVVFNVLRYGSELLTGRLIDDLGFEAVFNLVRLTTEAGILQILTGVGVRSDIAFPYSLIFAGLNIVNSLGQTNNALQGAIDKCVKGYLNYNPATDINHVLLALDNFDAKEHGSAIGFQTGTQTFNGLFSLLRGGTGVLGLQETAQKIQKGLTLSYFQSSLQSALTRFDSAIQTVVGTTSAELQVTSLIATLATAAGGLVEQAASVASIPGIVAKPVLAGASSAVSPSVVSPSVVSPQLSSALPSSSASSLVSTSEQPAILRAAPAKAASDSTAYIADLAQLVALVKAGNVKGITALYPQFAADDQALFNNDLIPLDNMASARSPKFDASQNSVFAQFDTVLNGAINSTLAAMLQLDTWGSGPATADAKAVTQQLDDAINSVTAAVQEAAAVRALTAGHTAPATLEIEETNVPLQVAAGTTQSFTFTVVNIGNKTSPAGTISFDNSDGSLIVQGAAARTLRKLPRGGSATFTWQVQAVTPPNSNYGSVYQVVATAGGLTSTIADQVFVS